ncbi:MAG: [LysW]-aminoadipate kinase [Calditrichia bacterium]
MIIIKIGGGKDINLPAIARDLSLLDDDMIIVHGANALRDELASRLNTSIKTVTSVSGYSSVFSDQEVIDLQMIAYAGLRNKRLVELLQQAGINAIGLSGLDGAVIRGKRNQGIRIHENGKLKLLRDFSGKPKEINRDLLSYLLSHQYLPVLTVPIIDETGQAINSENDDIVCLLQQHFKARIVIHLIEARGFLHDKDNPESVIKTLSQSDLCNLESKAKGRFKRKLLAIKRLIDNGSQKVLISDGRGATPVQSALNGEGTTIYFSES